MSSSRDQYRRVGLTSDQHQALFVQFLGWYKDSDFIFVAMEYVKHGSLSDYLDLKKSNDLSNSKEIIRQILEGLVVLHERKICHRDLKPDV